MDFHPTFDRSRCHLVFRQDEPITGQRRCLKIGHSAVSACFCRRLRPRRRVQISTLGSPELWELRLHSTSPRPLSRLHVHRPVSIPVFFLPSWRSLPPQQEENQNNRCVLLLVLASSFHVGIYRAIVVAADGLSKRDVFRLPDPFAVITVDAEQTHTTSVIKKTLNPYWNESFDM